MDGWRSRVFDQLVVVAGDQLPADRRGSTRWRPVATGPASADRVLVRRGEIAGLAPGVLRFRRGSSHKTSCFGTVYDIVDDQASSALRFL
jgi:hypothetical protein